MSRATSCATFPPTERRRAIGTRRHIRVCPIANALANRANHGEMVSPSGRFEFAFASMKIPGDATPISGRDIEMESVTITGVYTKTGRFRARIAATVTMPVIVTLEPEKNIALYDPVTEGAARPVHVLADFECTIPAE